MYISKGNSKLGKIPNFSLPPGCGCAPDRPCAKTCYALKAYRMYPSVRKAWRRNWRMVQDPIKRLDLFSHILGWLQKHKPERFRIHVSGDFIDQGYLDFWICMALFRPETRFAAYTKRYELDYSNLPKNLTVLFSRWPGFRKPETRMPQSWFKDTLEHKGYRIPKSAIECPGSCVSCDLCWRIKKGQHVYFKKH